MSGPGKKEQHEQMAREERHWVRLTRACNNRCAFCLDELSREGAILPEQQVLEEIQRGRERGAERLILSGGEPTIHPGFLGFIRAGREAGYGHVQVVSNGRMLSYPRLLRGAVRAGLNEVTISVHGHDDATHDGLVGVPGALAQTEAAIRAALATGRLIVSVDICLNRRNIGHLSQILERCMAMGVREFDLLHVIPFGRAFRDGEALLSYDMETARPELEKVLRLSERPDVHIWFNRFPPPSLEGYEHLIQDPHKLHDEVRGRGEELEGLVTRGKPLRCRQPGRCVHCYLRSLCDDLDEALLRLGRRDFDIYRVRVGGDQTGPAAPPPWPLARWWVRAPDLEAAGRALDGAGAREVTLELDSYDGIEQWLRGGAPGGAVVRRAYADSPAELERLLAAGPGPEVVAVLTEEVAEHLEREHADPPDRLALARRDHASAADSRRLDADLPAFFSRYLPPLPVEGVPACISGRAPRPGPSLLDAEILRRPLQLDHAGAPVIDIHGFTERFIVAGFMSKSLRCRRCALDGQCAGAQLNYLRAHGYRVLRPVERE